VPKKFLATHWEDVVPTAAASYVSARNASLGESAIPASRITGTCVQPMPTVAKVCQLKIAPYHCTLEIDSIVFKKRSDNLQCT